MNVWPLLWVAIEAVDTQLREQPVAGWLGESAVVGFWQTPKTNEDTSKHKIEAWTGGSDEADASIGKEGSMHGTIIAISTIFEKLLCFGK